MNSKKFSLIELLVVIAIIGILVTLIMAGFAGVSQQANNNATRSMMEQITAGINKYYQTNGYYPPADDDFETEELYKHLLSQDYGGPFLEIVDDFIQDGKFVDSFEEPIYYIPAAKYQDHESPTEGGALWREDPNNDDIHNYWNFTSFQLRSLGKNKIDDEGKVDDVQNFDVKKH